MLWSVLLADEFKRWFIAQTEAMQADILAVIEVLQVRGPQLSRPHADTLNGSKHSNMKELRVQHKGHPVRVAYAFDPQRSAIVLCAGDKTGLNEKRFYQQLIKEADAIFDRHLASLPGNV